LIIRNDAALWPGDVGIRHELCDDGRSADRGPGVPGGGLRLAGGGLGGLFENVSNTWSTLTRFLLTTAATSILVWEVASQARRGAPGAAIRWAGSDTANAAVLGGYAALLIAAMVFGHPPQHERTSGAAFVSLYLALAAYFVWLRRRTLAQQRRQATTSA
jgi:hypothetical protein